MAPDEMGGSVLDPNTARVRQGAQYGFPVGTALQVAPLAPMLATGARATARALGPTAVRMGEGYLQRQGLMPELDVYHGSPYKFDRFDASKIGTGEGAQSYGHGIYTAENPKVGASYQKDSPAQRIAREFMNSYGKDAENELLKSIDRIKSMGGEGIDHAAAINIVQSGKIPEHSFYKVDLPDEKIAKMLDWDKPLSEQPWVMSRVKPMLEDSNISLERIPLLTGKDLMSVDGPMAAWFGKNRTPSMFSEGLRQEGIPGIKYLDATSRGAGTGTRNFVTFPGEEKSLTILERNNQPVQQNRINSFIQ